VYHAQDQSRSLGRQAIGSVSLLLVVALALSTSMRVGRPMADAGRDGVPERATALTHQTAARPARRMTCEKPPASQTGVAARSAALVQPELSPAADHGRTPRPLRESLLDLPPPQA
jgi:hypothetical protein